MVEMKEIQAQYLHTYVHIAFENDSALIFHYHLVNGTLEKCVRSTVREIEKVVRRGEPLTCYAVLYNGTAIGFSVLGPNYLLAFGISISYRTAEIVPLWWKLICVALDEEFVTWIFKKNSRAIAFLKRNGMIVLEENDRYVSLGHYKQESVNQ